MFECIFYVLTMRCKGGIYKLQRHLTLSNMNNVIS